MKLPKVTKDRGYYLRVFRAERNLSQVDAAEFFGVTPSFWSLLESHDRYASPTVAAKIRKAIPAIDFDDLIGVAR